MRSTLNTYAKFPVGNDTFSVELQGPSQGSALDIIERNIRAGQPTIVRLPSPIREEGRPPYFNFTEGANKLDRTHFVLVYGVKPGTPPGAKLTPDNLIVSDSADAADDQGGGTLRAAVNAWSGGRWTAEEWFSDTPVVRNNIGDPPIKLSSDVRNMNVRRIILNNRPATINGSIRLPDQRDDMSVPAVRDLCFILTDLSTGARIFSHSDIAWQWYQRDPLDRIANDPFFHPPAFVTDTTMLIRYLNDPRYYDFAGRRDYFDPTFDQVEALVVDVESGQWFGDGPAPPTPEGLVILMLPGSIADTSLRLEVISPVDVELNLAYNTTAGDSTSAGELAGLVLNSVDAPLGTLLGEFQIVGAGEQSPPGSEVNGSLCPGDVNGDGRTNATDFSVLAGNFGSTVTRSTGGDLNGDGTVNAMDFSILAAGFGCSDVRVWLDAN
jgi:hypothetical protein